MQVVYTCPEMLQTPSVARVLHSDSFRAQLSGIYLDEAHTLHESTSWRPSYTNIHLLRRTLGPDTPFIALSATLPSSYRKSLEIYAGLKPDYRFINLGNFRPELSVIIAHMQHDTNSFLDLAFVLPWNSTEESIIQTIIYCDDLDILTKMFWWFHTRLGSMKLPHHLLDILHAGLSDDHQELCTKDFINGRAKILLGSDKIGAGMDFPSVGLVVQYRCRDLTLVKWEQRRGRGARREGRTAVGVILVEKSMVDAPNNPSVSCPKFSDPSLLDLIHSRDCLERVVETHLESPPRYNPDGSPITRCYTRCSNCNPNLRLIKDLTWIMENPTTRVSATPSATPLEVNPRAVTTQIQRDSILKQLREWRLSVWKRDWMDEWPMYGPDHLVSDADLTEIAKRAHNITTIPALISLTHMPHEEDLAAPLFTALQQILTTVCGPAIVHTPLASTHTQGQQAQMETNQSASSTPYPQIQWAIPHHSPDCPSSSDTPTKPTTVKRKRKNPALSKGELLISFGDN